MRRSLVGVLVLGLAQPFGAQNRSKLDEPVKGEYLIPNPRFLQPCDFGAAVEYVTRKAKVLVGFENTPDCRPSSMGGGPGANAEDLTGMSPHQALDHLMMLVPTFAWKEMDGVVVVRPKVAWSDPANPLNLLTAPFEATGPTLDDVLHTVLQAVTPPVFYPHDDVHAPGRPIDRPVAVAFPGGTMLEAVNAVVRARQDVNWQMGYSSGRAMIVLSTWELNGGSIMASVTLPHARR